MSDEDEEHTGTDASASSAPDRPEDVDPETGTNEDDEPIDNPSGG